MENKILAPLEWSTVKRLVKDLVPCDFNPRHLNITNVTNPEYLINNLFLGDRKSIENTGKAILNRIDKSKEQMLNKNINPHQLPYYIVWDLDLVDNLNINELKRNLTRKITPERGKKIRGMFFQYKGKAIYLSREDIINRKMDRINILLE